MKINRLLVFSALALLLLVSSVSASDFWGYSANNYGYKETKVVEKSTSHSTGDYYSRRNANTYEKTTTTKNYPLYDYSYRNNRNDYNNRYDNYDYDYAPQPRHYYVDDTHYTCYSGRCNSYRDETHSSNWRYKQDYRYENYGKDKSYNSYYYEPQYDWHLGYYNWRY